jgi:putative component of toxin-antitoxin plasmid stabilization module
MNTLEKHGGGDKSTQDEDIEKAKHYWTNYKQEKDYADY